MAVVNTVTVIDPEIVVLGGDLADLPHAETLFVAPIEAMTRRHVVGVPLVRVSQLLGDAALHGALHAAVGLALATAGGSGGLGAGMVDPSSLLVSAGIGSHE